MKPHVQRELDAELVVHGFLYHETKQEHLADICLEGIVPSSYGQSFVRDDGSIQSPDDALEEIKEELEQDGFDEELIDERADEILHEVHPASDFVRRTYVVLREPEHLNYGDVLLRFPRAPYVPTKKADVDWYIKSIVVPDALEVLRNGNWRRLC